MSEALRYLLTFLLSSGFIGFVQFLIQRNDNRNSRIDQLKKELEEEKDERERISNERYEEYKEAMDDLRKVMAQIAETPVQQQTVINANSELLVALTQAQLVELTNKYQERGAITLTEKSILTAIYEPYHDKLGGNGYGKMGYTYAMKLPVVTDEEAHKMDLEFTKKLLMQGA